MFNIEVRPATRPGLFTASLGDRHLVTSREPLLAAARVLMQEGADPADVLIMRWSTTGTESLTATIATAAGLTVKEPNRGRPHFAKMGVPTFLSGGLAHALYRTGRYPPYRAKFVGCLKYPPGVRLTPPKAM